MFGIGSTELLVILAVALIVLGPKNLPKVAQTLGKALGEFRKVSTDFQRTLNTELAFEEEKDKKEQAKIAAEKAKEDKKAREEEATSTAESASPTIDSNPAKDSTSSTDTNTTKTATVKNTVPETAPIVDTTAESTATAKNTETNSTDTNKT